MIETNTLQDYHDQGYTVGLECWKCGRMPDLDLAGLCAMGHGKTPLPGLVLRCECGERLQKIVQAPEKEGLLKDGRPIADRSVPTLKS